MAMPTLLLLSEATRLAVRHDGAGGRPRRRRGGLQPLQINLGIFPPSPRFCGVELSIVRSMYVRVHTVLVKRETA